MVLVKAFGRNRSGKRGGVPHLPVLGTIADLVATLGDELVTLVWSAVRGGVQYQMQYKLTSEPTVWTDYGALIIPPAIVGGTVSALTNATSYDFRVIAGNGYGSTTTSNTDSATPAAGPPGMVAVTDLANNAIAGTTYTVQWTMGTDGLGAAAKYALRILSPAIDADSWYLGAEVLVDTGLATSGTKTYQFTGLTAGTVYGVMLLPYRGTPNVDAVYGDFSNPVADTTTGTPAALGTIADLAAPNIGDAQVGLTWTPAENATSHQPEYKLNTEPTTWTSFGSALGASASSVTVTGLTNASLYNFRVQAGDGVTTTNSNTVNATPVVSGSLEPGDMTFNVNQPFTVAAPSPWLSTASAGSYGVSGGIGTMTQPSGMSGGSVPHILSYEWNGLFHKTAYVKYTGLKFRTGWVGHESGVNKVGFLGDLSEGAGKPIVVLAYGSGSGTLLVRVHTQSSTDTDNYGYNGSLLGKTNLASPTAGQAEIVRGTAHDVEVLAVCNTPGSSDGSFKLALGGVLILHYTGIQFVGSGADGKFSQIDWNPVWGGNGGPALTAEQYMDMDNLRFSAKN